MTDRENSQAESVAPAEQAAAQAAAAGVPHDRATAKMADASLKAENLAAAADSPGVKSTLAVIDFVVACAQAVEAAEADDGKLTIADMMKLGPVVPTVLPMISALHLVPGELSSLNADEVEVLLAEAAKAFPGMSSADTVLKVKDCLAFAEAGYKVFADFKK